ncbi:MAG TPA: IS110 family transposase [Gemmatimonadaceae bacterium]|nr:IS110 family transposase [Gemmatimonadaceae bacterium]
MTTIVPVAALDVHAASIRLAAVHRDELLDERTLAFDHELVERELRKLGVGRVCYEAGPTGFGLARHLRAAGFHCDVIAPGLVPWRSSDRVKTDKRDARKLALMYQGGMLQPIFVPSESQEAVRDLIRAREDARMDRMRARHRIGKFVLRHDRRMPSKGWTLTRRQWLGQQAFTHAAQQAAFDDYLLACDLVDRRIETMERQIDEWAVHDDFRKLVGALRCFRGIDTLTAVGLVAEIGDFTRFKTAPSFMAYLGLVPSESSSGDQRRQGAITKTGNTHARRLMIEAAHNQRRRPARSGAITRRQAGQPAEVVARAQHAQLRLHKRWNRMASRGKHSNKIATSVARELAGFVWATATDQPLRATDTD